MADGGRSASSEYLSWNNKSIEDTREFFRAAQANFFKNVDSALNFEPETSSVTTFPAQSARLNVGRHCERILTV
ncbi:hypothetical protein E2C01_045178 [Portunus trituberculatus]|uniref:Uncharacterized protein n=1 Tax=Portunus trituberculatus TaxID=210409 RepID=A0A5B7G4C0_PORTR|nr:hypothetical protein [Portunus trituberculatus]